MTFACDQLYNDGDCDMYPSELAEDIGTIRERVLAAIEEFALDRKGPFTLASGRVSDYYLDIKQVSLRGRVLDDISTLIWEKIRGDHPEAVGGLTLGADPLIAGVSIAAAREGVDLIGLIVRSEAKDHGKGRKIAGPTSGKYRIVLLDDVTTTGLSTTLAGDALEAAGHAIIKVVSIVDRAEGAQETFDKRHWNFDPLFSKSDLRVE